MKNKLVPFILMLAIILASGANGFAQEVFFKDPNTQLKTITPDYYYPLRYNQDPFSDIINPGNDFKLRTDDHLTRLLPVASRWGIENAGVRVTADITPIQSYGGLAIPNEAKAAILSNKVLNMSFWVRLNGNVTDPDNPRSGAVFCISSGNVMPKVSVEVEDRKVKVFISKGQKLVPIMSTDFPIGWEDVTPGLETNGYFFFCITSTWSEEQGNRCRIYVGRPGGRLYCKYFYCSPFANNQFTTSEDIYVGKPAVNYSTTDVRASRAIGIADLMLYTSGYMATYMMNPEDVLNNFYVQSPLYEGVSYQILKSESILGLETRKNEGEPLAENYIAMSGRSSSITPFGFDRFYIEKDASTVNGFKVRNMANGGALDPYGAYLYTKFVGGGQAPVWYLRKTDDPSNNYNIAIAQFGLINYYNRDQSYQSYQRDGVNWLIFGSESTQETRLHIQAATKVFRGPERNLEGYVNGKVTLKTYGHGSATGSLLKYGDVSNWNYVGLTQANKEYSMFLQTPAKSTYIKNTFEVPPPIKYLSAYNGRGDIVDRSWLIMGDYKANWEFLHVKKDANGKPLYILRTANGNAGLKAGVASGDYNASQQYLNALEADGSVNDRRLWSISKIGGGQALSETEKASLERLNAKSAAQNGKPANNSQFND